MRSKLWIREFITGILILQGCLASKIKIENVPLDKYFLKKEVFKNSFVGFCLYDPVNKKYLYDINGGKFFTPASNMKVFTFYAGRKILGDSIPALKYCITKDTLYFSGTGDPTFLYPGFNTQPVYKILKHSTRKLSYVPGSYPDKRFGPGWAWDDFPYYFSAEKSSFPIYGNSMWVEKSSRDSSLSVIPSIFRNQIDLIRDPTMGLYDLKLQRKEYTNHYSFAYNQLPDSVDQAIPFIYSNNLFKILLEDTLKRNVTLFDTFPDCLINIVNSQATDSLVKAMLVESDNFFAEQILLMSSYLLFDKLKSSLVIEFARKNFFQDFRDRINWIDGSGLSRYNQVTPHAMIDIFDLIFNQYDWSYITSIFPAGGKSGTLKNDYLGDPPYIVGKTGSLSHVYNLSGFLVTTNGRILIFSFMNNNFNVQKADLQKEMEKVLRDIARNF